MMKNTVICVASSDRQAGIIVDYLRSSGFSSNDVSVLFPDKAGPGDAAHGKSGKAVEGAEVGAGAGGLVGGTLGWLAGIGALVVPGFGAIMAAGPIMVTLSGVAVGASLGSVAGALVGLGVPEREARRYEGRVKEGYILISVHASNPEEIDRARRIFRHAGASDISVTDVVRVKEWAGVLHPHG